METSETDRTTRVRRRIQAPRDLVYRLLLDPAALSRWKVPDGMTAQVHKFEPRMGGEIRVSFTYETPGSVGKTTTHTDTYRGRFLRLVPNEQVVEVDEFETENPALHGVMVSTISLADTNDGGTEVVGLHARMDACWSWR
jgi:uncharacterized protein YndB with AHSA1/START domain